MRWLLPTLGISRSVPAEENWLDEAEKLGDVELDTWLGVKKARITIGKFGDTELRIWGTGDTPTEALRAAVLKTRPILKALMGNLKPEKLT